MEEKVYSVAELTREVKGLLEGRYFRVWVQGELSSLGRPASGHLYFNLKDSNAQIGCAFFKNAAARCPFTLEEGMEVVARGRVSVYEPRGQYQLIVDELQPVGEGALQLAFEQLKARLEAEGIFDTAHKQPIPWLPKGIAIVTSPTGAAIQDIFNVLNRRFAGIPLLVYPSLVQGQGAAAQLKGAIEDLQAYADQVDVILLSRGGGSLEDLWAFNDEGLARAIFASKIPVISAVGHETDFTIADWVADLRAPTPSAGAELAVPLKEELMEAVASLDLSLRRAWHRQFSGFQQRLESQTKRLRNPQWVIQAQAQRVDEAFFRLKANVRHRLSEQRRRLEVLSEQLEAQNPKTRLAAKRERLEGLTKRLHQAIGRPINQRRAALSELTRVLDSVSPLQVLKRGFAATRTQKGQLVRSVEQAQIGQVLDITLEDGTLTTQITAIANLKGTHG
ncbi:MAG: exodeoxyribonuclease VII large subunit [bacterium]|nr:exodeoxyribonuclease VII large subunit [bacterium]